MHIVGIELNKKGKMLDAYISFMIWFFALASMMLLAIIKESILPEKFFYDSITIKEIIPYVNSFSRESAFTSTAFLFKIFNVTDNTIIFSVISSFYILFIIYSSIKLSSNKISICAFAIVFFYSFMSMAYMTLLSKDIIVFIIVSSLIVFRKTKFFLYVAFYVLCGIYIIWFRAYWSIYLVLTFCTIFSYWRCKSIVSFMFCCLLIIVVLCIAFKIFLGVNADFHRVAVTETRLELGDGSASRTIIHQFIKGDNPVVSSINVIITWLAFILPIPLLMVFTPYYIFLFCMISFFYYLFYRSFNEEIKNGFTRHGVFASIVVAYTLLQSFFEPDYGSAVRHLAPFYPIMFFVISKYYSNLIKNE